jgi:predicted permease
MSIGTRANLFGTELVYHTVMSNLKLAFRMLVKTPFVSIVAILSLALGIGANTAIISVFDQLLRRPLPVEDPYRLVNLQAPGPKSGSTSCNMAGSCEAVFSYPMFRDLEKGQTPFTSLAAHRLFGANLAAAGQTFTGDGLAVSSGYFPTLGIQPALGRFIGPDDDRVEGDGRVAVLSHAFWQDRFAGSPDILSTPLVVNGQAMTIIGVAPRGFSGTTIGERPLVFVPITLRELMQPGVLPSSDRQSYWVYLFARLKPGVTIEQARAALTPLYSGIINQVEAPLQKNMSEQTLERFKTKPIVVEDGAQGQSEIGSEASTPTFLLMGVTAIVLLIACANIANLLLARSASRAAEMAVRLSLGASRRQLIVQLLTESLLLAACGGVAGLFFASATLRVITWLLPAEAAATIEVQLSATVLLVSAVLTLGTGFLFGLYPSLHSTRPDLISSLKNQAGQPSGAKAAARFRVTLATAQIALSMMLLVSAGLFAKSLVNVMRAALGLNPDHVVTFGISPQLNGYKAEQIRQLAVRITDELAALPGVSSVTGGLVPVLAGSNWGSNVSVEGFDAGPDTDTNSRYNEVLPGYFSTLGIPLLAGHEITAADGFGAPKVALVNESFAKKFNLGTDPVGRMIATGRSRTLDIRIIGLVKDSKYSEVKGDVPPLFFRPILQNERIGSLNFYIRTAVDPEAFLANIPRTVARVDPNLPVSELRTLQQQIRENVFLDRFISIMSASFAILATVLAAIGLYGVLAYTVVQRTREIGLRMALGAAPSRVRGMVLGQVSRMTIVGGIVGLSAAWGLSRLAQSLLYQMSGSDPIVLVGSAAALSLVALAAGFVPALKASRVEPMRALRYE